MPETITPGTTRYYCPLNCGWHHDVPPPGPDDVAGISPSADAATWQEAVASIVGQAALRQAESTEAAVREHAGTHGIHTVEELRAAIPDVPPDL
jgi:hypothetical protein